MAIDLTHISSLTVQINSLQTAMATATDPGAKALIGAQISMLSAELSSEVAHAQSQADASSNLINTMGMLQTLTSVVGNAAPSIISLFKP